MWICDKDQHCIDCPKNYPDEQCEHWVEVDYVKHGHWIMRMHDENYDGGYPLYHCSLCDRTRPHNLDNYCPECGARMSEHFADIGKKVDEVSECT